MPTTTPSHDELIGFIDTTLYNAGLTPEELYAYREWTRGQGVRDWGAADRAKEKIQKQLGGKDPALFHILYQNTVNKGMKGDPENYAYLYKELSGQQAVGDQPTADPRLNITAQIQAFVDAMDPKHNPNDPVRLSLIEAGTDAAQAAAGRAGLGASGRSGLVGSSAASLAQRNITPYEAQKAQLRAQGLGLLNQRDLGLGQLELAATQLQNMQAANKWSAQQNAFQGALGFFGGAAGGLVGGYFGGPQGAQAGMTAGSSLGGGVGGLVAPNASTGPAYASPSLGSGKNPFTGY